MQTQSDIVIDRPIEEVFECTSNHVAEWSSVVVSEEVILATPNHVGSLFRLETQEHGRLMTFDGVVTDYDAPYYNAIHLTGPAFEIEVEYNFEDLGQQTRVTQTSIVKASGLMKCFFVIFGWAMNRANRRALERELQSLKQFCEDNVSG